MADSAIVFTESEQGSPYPHPHTSVTNQLFMLLEITSQIDVYPQFLYPPT